MSLSWLIITAIFLVLIGAGLLLLMRLRERMAYEHADIEKIDQMSGIEGLLIFF